MFELTGIRQRYGERTVLAVDDLALERGARVAVVGPNGAGKSTLLRLLAFLEQPTAGTIALDGQPVRGAVARRAARRRVTLVEQHPYLFRGTALANVAFGLRARGASAAAAGRRAREALAVLHSAPLAARDARTLSAGEAQRVALARALATGPDALLLDEPASGADRAARHTLYAAIAEAQERKPIVVCLASHLLEDAYRWADRMVALNEGTPTPLTPENLFRVELAGGAPLQRVALGPITVEVVTDKSGPATLAIPPDEIVLSTEGLHSSARNVIAGRIIRATAEGAAMRITLDAGVDLVALITRRSFDELGLVVGGPAYACFKSVAVKVF